MLYDIIVFEEDEMADGSLGMKSHPENGIHASSRKELIGLYGLSGQKVKIIREYPENSNDMISANPQNVKTISATPMKDQLKPVIEQTLNIKPKFFKVAGIECKLENNKLYQKQWTKLNAADAENYRIVSDANNKIQPLVGKHIERLSWVIVEDQNSIEAEAAE